MWLCRHCRRGCERPGPSTVFHSVQGYCTDASLASNLQILVPRAILFPRSHRYPPWRNYATTSKSDVDPSANPVLADYLKKNRNEPSGQSSRRSDQKLPTRGSLASTSLVRSLQPPRMRQGLVTPTRTQYLDPKPQQRRRWERKMVIRSIRRRGRLSRQEEIKRTERSYVLRSEWQRTSVKKLSPLANQIAGKPIEDAIVQMSFSKKKHAVAVKNHLIAARDRAIVERGMGLGRPEGRAGRPTEIKLKDGSKHRVKDRTGIYVDQAWVGKGSYGLSANPRAKGRIDRLRLPQTSKSTQTGLRWRQLAMSRANSVR